jgi:hypothetical protein
MRAKSFILALLMVTVAACGGGDPGADGSAPDAAAANGAAAGDGSGPAKQFPPLEYLEQIPVAYATAKSHPEVLENIPCYCPCMLYGHRGLADCHRSQHSAACATCLEEAVAAGQLIEEKGADDPLAIAAEVTSRYRAAIVRNQLQSSDLPGLGTDEGRAYLAACSACHQPAHPAMYTADGWRRSLARMEAYVEQSDTVDISPEMWTAAVTYIREAAEQFPPESGERYRQQIETAAVHLVETEGAGANYPTNEDQILGPEWFERMLEAYRLARDIPAARLAAVQLDDPSPACQNLLQCLNSSAAVTSEAAVLAIEELAAELDLGND